MSSPPGFVALILTNRRPDNVRTYRTLRTHGYTGPIRLVVDDEDPTRADYERAFPGEVVVFDKREIARRFDEADNFQDRRSIFYARNASFDIARSLGFPWFVQLDDDYNTFQYRFEADGRWAIPSVRIRSLDRVWGAMVRFMEQAPQVSTVAMSQGGDHIGGPRAGLNKYLGAKRKAMNSFVCHVDRRIEFRGRVNEDVSTYALANIEGKLMLTLNQVQLDQQDTQKSDGGMTGTYLDGGTYWKSFYSVVHAPSAVKISTLGMSRHRIHHEVSTANAVQVLRPKHRKGSA